MAQDIRTAQQLAQVRHMVRAGQARRIRLAALLSQAEVAEEVGVSPSAVARWESGGRLPSWHVGNPLSGAAEHPGGRRGWIRGERTEPDRSHQPMSVSTHAQELVARTTSAQGLPQKLTDSSTLAKLASILAPVMTPATTGSTRAVAKKGER